MKQHKQYILTKWGEAEVIKKINNNYHFLGIETFKTFGFGSFDYAIYNDDNNNYYAIEE